jgi:uncharacterized protein
MTSDSKIDYEALSQDAMRGLIRTVLQRTARIGLPGEHHFYISFDTNAPGVSISKRLREKYPNEMTIVLQHRFWDLTVNEERFEVKLTFDGIPERVVVPFTAIKVFFDPSVRYGLQFEEPEFNSDAVDLSVTSLEQSFTEMDPAGGLGSANGASSGEHVPLNHPARTHAQGSEGESPDASQTVSGSPETESDDDEPEKETAGAEIVSLDAFRKK